MQWTLNAQSYNFTVNIVRMCQAFAPVVFSLHLPTILHVGIASIAVGLNVWSSLLIKRKWFEPRSDIPWLKKIIQVMESWEGLLFATDISTACVEAIFRVKWLDLEDGFAQVVETSVANNSPSQDSNSPSWKFKTPAEWFDCMVNLLSCLW